MVQVLFMTLVSLVLYISNKIFGEYEKSLIMNKVFYRKSEVIYA